MSAINSKWSTLFPKTIGNETRSDKPIDNTQAYETDGFPQFMGNDPVRYDLQNAIMTQAMSNDERLKEKIDNIETTYVKKSGDTMAGTLDGTAKNAINDSDGKPINTTYLKKADLPTKVSAFKNDAKYLHTADLLDKVYPVGAIYLSMVSTDPGTLFGGTWKRISQGRMLLGADDSTYKAGATGGSATETLNINQIPGHTHSGSTSWANLQGSWGGFSKESNGSGIVSTTSTYNTKIVATGYDDSWGKRQHINASHNHSLSINSTGGGQAHNNMSPYLAVYIWQRTK